MADTYNAMRPALGDAERIRQVLRVLADDSCRELIAQLAARPADLDALASAMVCSPEILQSSLDQLIEARLVAPEQAAEGCVFRLTPNVRASVGRRHTALAVTTEGGSKLNLRLPRS
jgi:hypothetical protein